LSAGAGSFKRVLGSDNASSPAALIVPLIDAYHITSRDLDDTLVLPIHSPHTPRTLNLTWTEGDDAHQIQLAGTIRLPHSTILNQGFLWPQRRECENVPYFSKRGSSVRHCQRVAGEPEKMFGTGGDMLDRIVHRVVIADAAREKTL